MREPGRHQTADVDLPDALGAGAGEQGVVLDERQGVRDRRVVCRSMTAAVRVSATAHNADTDFTARTSDRTRRPPSSPAATIARSALPVRGIGRIAPELRPEELPTHLAADPRPHLQGHRSTRRQPLAVLWAANRFATSTRNGDTSGL